MFTITNRRSQLVRLAAFLIAIAALVLVGLKTYNSLMKMYDFRKAEASLKEKNMIDAEAYYAKASNNGWIKYREPEIEEAVASLAPVTEIKGELLSVIDRSNGENPKDLMAALTQYQTMKKASAAKGGEYGSLFADISDHFDIDRRFEDSFADYKKDITKQLQTAAKKKSFSDELVASYLQIPAQYFGGLEKKQTEIAERLSAYDNARIDAAAEEKKFEEVLQEGVRLKAIYAKYKVKPEWLIAKLDQYALDRLSASVKNNRMDVFSKDAVRFEKTPGLAVKGSETLAYISKTINERMQQAANLGKSKKYAEAIDLYEQIDAYRSTDKKIRDIELQWAVDEPGHILLKVAPGQEFSNIINGKDAMGALLYAAGTSNGKLVLARMMKDMSMNKKEASIDGNLAIQSIGVANNLSSNPVILIEGKSSARKTRYVAYEVRSSSLNKILDVEADGFSMEKPGTMVVDNPVGTGAGEEAYYAFSNGAYHFKEIKPDYVEISLANLSKYKDVKVRFSCTILASDGATAVVMYNDQYVLLYDAANMREGKATVTGTWVGNEEIKKGDQSISAFKVKVSSISQ